MSFKEEKIELNDNKDYKWYIIQTYNALTARGSLSQDDRKKAEKLQEIFNKAHQSHLIKEVFVAIEEKKNLYTNETHYNNIAPGYIFVKMLLNNEAKGILTNNQSKVGFIMGGYSKPHVVSEEEIANMKKQIEIRNNTQEAFIVGDVVRIMHREFTDFNGIITELFDDGQANVSISIFGRNTVVKFSIKDLEKIGSQDY